MKKGNLFELHQDLNIYNKTIKIKKKKLVAPEGKAKGEERTTVSKASSVQFYDDQQPIQLSGPGGHNYQLSVDWDVQSFGNSEVEDIDYSLQSETTEAFGWEQDAPQAEATPQYEQPSYTQPEAPSYGQSNSEDVEVEYMPQPSAREDRWPEPPAPEVHKPAMRHPDPLKALGEAVKGMSDDEFAADLAAILEGNKVFDPDQKQLVSKDKVDDGFVQKLKEADAQRSNGSTPAKGETDADKDKENQHAIFDRIAQNMSFANSFDLGTFEMEQRFDSFDDDNEGGSSFAPGAPPMPPMPPMPKMPDLPRPGDLLKGGFPNPLDSLPFSTEDFVKDLDLINVQSEAMEKAAPGKDWPPRPANLNPLTLDQKKQLYGMFAYEAAPTADNAEAIRVTDNWAKSHIQWVDLPQLSGKLIGKSSAKKTINKAGMEFHTKGAKQLKALFADWEKAGLLDRILTFNGSYVPRYIRGTKPEERSDRKLSNHSWGTAFDINAEWNARGSVPALVGTKGCTRELVEIANKHGFFWGGHFGGSSVDGMHFELVQIIP